MTKPDLDVVCGGTDLFGYSDHGNRDGWAQEDAAAAQARMDANMADGIMADSPQGQECDFWRPCAAPAPVQEGGTFSQYKETTLGRLWFGDD